MPLTPKRAGSVAYSFTMFLVVSMLAGLLVAGLAVPFAGIAGVSSRATAAEMEKIPAEFTTPPQPERSNVYMANGDKLATFYEQDRVYEPLSKIAPVMQQAQVAIEDHRYFTHGALDLQGTLRALLRNTAGGSTQGGSSITQQYVKMVRIEQAQLDGDQKGVAAATDETYARKIQELRYAIALEKQLSKDQILERYLNIAYYGDGSYGVEAAARHYFSTTAAKLTLPQAAMLAGLVQNPTGTNPVLHPQAASDRRDVVLNRMAELNVITPAQATAAKKTKFDKDKVKVTPNGCIDAKYPFLCNYVLQSMLQDPALGKTVEDRKNAVMRGGLNIQTEIDPDDQDKAQTAVSDFINPEDPLISTMNEVEPGTGLIVAMAQSRPVLGSNTKKGQTYYNYSASATYGGAEGYQSGSTMKAITMAAALEAGYPITKRYNAKSPLNMSGTKWKSCDGQTQVAQNYKPQNDVGHSTNINMRTAAEYSVNTYFLQLEQDVGVCDVTKMAKKLGIERADGRDITVDSNSLAFTLGISEITPISLASAYATFAARGIHCDPIIIKKITNRSGDNVAVPSANCKRVISADVADGVNDLLGSVIKTGTGKPAYMTDGRPQAGKTGTIEDNAAVWFAGYTPELAGVAMIAKDKRRQPVQEQPDPWREGGAAGERWLPRGDRWRRRGPQHLEAGDDVGPQGRGQDEVPHPVRRRGHGQAGRDARHLRHEPVPGQGGAGGRGDPTDQRLLLQRLHPGRLLHRLQPDRRQGRPVRFGLRLLQRRQEPGDEAGRGQGPLRRRGPAPCCGSAEEGGRAAEEGRRGPEEAGPGRSEEEGRRRQEG